MKVGVEQCFSTRISPYVTFANGEDTVVVPVGEMLLAGHPTMHRTSPTTKDDLD